MTASCDCTVRRVALVQFPMAQTVFVPALQDKMIASQSPVHHVVLTLSSSPSANGICSSCFGWARWSECRNGAAAVSAWPLPGGRSGSARGAGVRGSRRTPAVRDDRCREKDRLLRPAVDAVCHAEVEGHMAARVRRDRSLEVPADDDLPSPAIPEQDVGDAGESIRKERPVRPVPAEVAQDAVSVLSAFPCPVDNPWVGHHRQEARRPSDRSPAPLAPHPCQGLRLHPAETDGFRKAGL